MPGSAATADALKAERTRLGLIAQNIANQHNTRDVDGQPYQRKVAVFESCLKEATSNGLPAVTGVRVAKIVSDKTPGPVVYDPGHPHADVRGMVAQSNVQPAREMADLIVASQAYQANLKAWETSMELARQSLQIGK